MASRKNALEQAALSQITSEAAKVLRLIHLKKYWEK
jgi:hypothetical protein